MKFLLASSVVLAAADDVDHLHKSGGSTAKPNSMQMVEDTWTCNGLSDGGEGGPLCTDCSNWNAGQFVLANTGGYASQQIITGIVAMDGDYDMMAVLGQVDCGVCLAGSAGASNLAGTLACLGPVSAEVGTCVAGETGHDPVAALGDYMAAANAFQSLPHVWAATETSNHADYMAFWDAEDRGGAEAGNNFLAVYGGVYLGWLKLVGAVHDATGCDACIAAQPAPSAENTAEENLMHYACAIATCAGMGDLDEVTHPLLGPACFPDKVPGAAAPETTTTESTDTPTDAEDDGNSATGVAAVTAIGSAVVAAAFAW